MSNILADICFWFHWVWIATLLITLIPIHPIIPIINKIVVTTTIVSQVVFLGCPLTYMESYLRGDDMYFGSFTAHYLSKFGIDIPPGTVLIFLLVVLCVNFIVFGIGDNK